MKIIFAHPGHQYGSYRYFRKLVDLSGFESCGVEEMDLKRDDVVYITSPANRALSDFLKFHDRQDVRAKVIYWNLERPDVPTEPVWSLPTTAVHADTQSVRHLPGVVASWVSDRYQSKLDNHHQFVVLGGHPGVRTVDATLPKAWDLCHFSYIWGRREIIRSLKGFGVAPENLDGVERETVLCSSRAILSVHQTPAPVLEVLRSAWSAAYKLPLICENVEDPWPLKEGESIATFGYETIQRDLEAIFELERSEGYLTRIGQKRYDLLCGTYNFRDCVEEGVKVALK